VFVAALGARVGFHPDPAGPDEALIPGTCFDRLRGPVLVGRPRAALPPDDLFGPTNDPPLPVLVGSTIEVLLDLHRGDRAAACEVWALVREVGEALGATGALAVFDQAVVIGRWEPGPGPLAADRARS
jgi:hypothetical protein